MIVIRSFHSFLISQLVADDDSDSLDEEDLALLEENMGIKLARNEGVSSRFFCCLFLCHDCKTN
jgi:hypothetical protein